MRRAQLETGGRNREARGRRARGQLRRRGHTRRGNGNIGTTFPKEEVRSGGGSQTATTSGATDQLAGPHQHLKHKDRMKSEGLCWGHSCFPRHRVPGRGTTPPCWSPLRKPRGPTARPRHPPGLGSRVGGSKECRNRLSLCPGGTSSGRSSAGGSLRALPAPGGFPELSGVPGLVEALPDLRLVTWPPPRVRGSVSVMTPVWWDQGHPAPNVTASNWSHLQRPFPTQPPQGSRVTRAITRQQTPSRQRLGSRPRSFSTECGLH